MVGRHRFENHQRGIHQKYRIPDVEEYRVFVKGRRIQGMSRYDYINSPRREHTPDVVAAVEREAVKYLEAIDLYFPLDNYVFDIGIAEGHATLIEISPYSGPHCLDQKAAILRYCFVRPSWH